MAEKNTSEARQAQGKQGGGGLWFGLLAFAASVVIVPAVAALLIVGLAPTIVSWLANQSPNRRPQVLTVLVFNLAGILPYLAKVLRSSRGLDTVMDITTNVFSWLVMYGAASAAMVVLLIAPQMAALALQMMAQERMKNVTTAQARLVEDWGEEVAGKSG